MTVPTPETAASYGAGLSNLEVGFRSCVSGSKLIALNRPKSLEVLLLRKGRLVHTIPYNTILYYTILYYTILYYTILYYTILYYTILYYTILYYTILYYTILYYTILYYTILYYTILYYTILYYTILYYTILYLTILYPIFPVKLQVLVPELGQGREAGRKGRPSMQLAAARNTS